MRTLRQTVRLHSGFDLRAQSPDSQEQLAQDRFDEGPVAKACQGGNKTQ